MTPTQRILGLTPSPSTRNVSAAGGSEAILEALFLAAVSPQQASTNLVPTDVLRQLKPLLPATEVLPEKFLLNKVFKNIWEKLSKLNELRGAGEIQQFINDIRPLCDLSTDLMNTLLIIEQMLNVPTVPIGQRKEIADLLTLKVLIGELGAPMIDFEIHLLCLDIKNGREIPKESMLAAVAMLQSARQHQATSSEIVWVANLLQPIPAVDVNLEQLKLAWKFFFSASVNEKQALKSLLDSGIPDQFKILVLGRLSKLPPLIRERLYKFQGTKNSGQYMDRLIQELFSEDLTEFEARLNRAEQMLEQDMLLAEQLKQDIAKLATPIEEELAKQFPALRDYKTRNPGVTLGRADEYGGDAVQARYHAEQRNNTLFALDCFARHRTMENKGDALRELLLGMGLKRRYTAWINGTKHWEKFGKPVTSEQQLGWLKPAGITVTPNRYQSNSITLDGITYRLTEATYDGMIYRYSSFWQEGDPVFREATRLYTELLDDATHEVEGKLRGVISDFHHLIDNVCPLERGTAAVMESVVDAGWLGHDFTPPDPMKLDEKALQTDRKTFAIGYPEGEKYSK